MFCIVVANSEETIDELRQRLNHMKRMMGERHSVADDRRMNDKTAKNSVIDGSFLSVVFGIAFLVIVTVSIYAFYNLYHAILKKIPKGNDEFWMMKLLLNKCVLWNKYL